MQKVIVVGNLGKDAEVKSFDSGMSVVNFSVGATERGYTKADGTQVPDHTEWFNCSLWGKNIDKLASYLTKGQKVAVEGKNRTRSYDVEDGGKRYVTELIVENVELLGGAKNTESSEASTPTQSAPKTTKNTNTAPAVEDTSDDLPF